LPPGWEARLYGSHGWPGFILIPTLIWGDELKGDTIRRDAGSVMAVRKDPSSHFAESAKQIGEKFL